MKGKSTIRTGAGGLSSPRSRDSSHANRSPRATWRRRLLLSQTSGRRASHRPGSIARLAGGMLLAIAAACPHSTVADEPECPVEIVELEPGKIRLRGADGTSKRVDSAELLKPICVLEVVEERPQYRVSVADGKWEGVWLIKRRNVVRIKGLVNVECSRSTISAGVEIRSERAGGVRAIGEEPCN